jgi:hypothetical protein
MESIDIKEREKHTLLVVTTGNLEEVTLELITESIAGNLFENKSHLAFCSPIVCVYSFSRFQGGRRVGEWDGEC